MMTCLLESILSDALQSIMTKSRSLGETRTNGCCPTLTRAIRMRQFSSTLCLTSGKLSFYHQRSGTLPQRRGWLSPHSPKERWDCWFLGQSGQSLLVSFTSNSNNFSPYLPIYLFIYFYCGFPYWSRLRTPSIQILSYFIQREDN